VFVIFFFGSKQYYAKIGDILKLDRILFDPGTVIKFDKILLLEENNKVNIGKPFLKYIIEAEINSHGKYKKIDVMKYKRRKHYKRSIGHRQCFTEVKILNIKKI
jgi:large subunit ribosomal protein L21